MKAHLGLARSHRFWYLPLAVLTATAFLTVLQPFQENGRGGKLPAVIYSHGVLHTSIPYSAEHAGRGQLAIEVLDPDDAALGRWEEQAAVAKGEGQWQADIKLSKALPIDALVWHRLHYRFTYEGEQAAMEGTESISQILRMPVVHILGQQSYLTGGDAAVRVICTDSMNVPIPGASSVRIDLLPERKKPIMLFMGRLNARGTTEAQFRFPAGMVGSYALRYAAETPIGSAEFTQQVRLEDKVSILLTSEKPIYQPGQTIHARALALDRAHHEATGGRRLTFEVEDPRGNKVFKKATQTDKFGIASAEFELADEVNLGTYHLRALMGAEEAAQNRSEIALNVERYVLPKFKVAVDLTGKDNGAKHGYRPGDHVTGTVRANYFFGKPVDDAAVTLKASGMDVTQFEAVSAHGKTDAEGAYRFDVRLPDYFAGRPLSHGAARVLIEATVKDAAGHAETRGEPITVSESPLMVTAVPEGGSLIPHLENQVFVLTSYPDGKPAVARIKVRAPGNADQNVSTDEGGVAIVHLQAGDAERTIKIDATDSQGNRATNSVRLDARTGAEQILLRTERAVYRAGDRIALRVFSTKKQGTAYIDVIRDGQTVLTRDVDIFNGQAELTLAATPALTGTVDINAYQFGRDAQPVGDHRLMFVEPAGELKIEATADAAAYQPGGEARVRFRVTNGHGEGVEAALGLQVVDEAVFALAEKQPGFAKVFFYLEQEAMKPRYEIHSVSMPEIVEPAVGAAAQRRDRAARALFAATEMVTPDRFETEFGRTVPVAQYAAYFSRYQSRYDAQMHRLAAVFSRAFAQNGGDLAKAALKMEQAPELRDAWGDPLLVEADQRYAYTRNAHYVVRSAGMDKQLGTADDLTGYLQVVSRPTVAQPGSGASRMDIATEHDRGPYNGLAEITGSVADLQGGALEGASVTVESAAGGSARKWWVTTDGHFTLAGLPPGDYNVKISFPPETISRRVKLQARDRAVCHVTLRVESSGRVEVAAPPVRMRMGDNLRFANMDGVGVGAGFGAGVAAGGVIGGVVANAMMAAAPPLPAPRAKMAVMARDVALLPVNSATLARVEIAQPAVHVRAYFPEALYINPEIITDRNGEASITIPLADSITTWRMAMLASTPRGVLGSAVSSLKVFQDFFVDLDLPVTLTQGDRVSLPVAVYNYSAARGDVRLELKAEDWYALVDDNAVKTVAVDAGRVGSSEFTLEARRTGKFKLTLAARMNGGNNPADMVVREIEVVPNGREQNVVFNGRLETEVRQDVNFPAKAIADASKIFVRLYPGPLSQVVEGMDAILRMPSGCFEQTSSATYPNVLALDYMKRTRKLTPEVHAKAEGFIANGYQRLLTFEVPGGGFSWFGNAPANKILTAYGVMEFRDMSRVSEVDPRLIERTQQWLAAQQQADGSWKPDTGFINEGATNRYNTDVLRITAYIGWALQNSGYNGPAAGKAKEYVARHLNGKPDSYTLAVAANFAADYGKDREFTEQAMHMLLDARSEKDEQAWWTADETGVYATGASAAVETTGLAVQALLKWGEASGTAGKALRYIASKKDASGTWGTTQATIMALRALLLSTEKGAADVRGTVAISLDGKPAKELVLTADNNDLLHQFVFPADAQSPHRVEVRFDGKGGLAYQVVGRSFVPWDEKPAGEPLSIDVSYDRTHLAQDDIATVTATVKNNLHKSANMVMVDLGIPPGFDLLSEDLQDYQEKSAGKKSGRMEKFNLTATQAILYFDSIGAGDTVTLHYRLRAKYPIRARTFESRVYEYYDPAVSAVARPVSLEVRKR